jgi:hypothetical protein
LLSHLATDASGNGIGGALYQLDDLDKPRYISFAISSLKTSERNYGATQRELLAIIKHFDYYISGSKFTLFTYHKALTFLITQKKLSPHIINCFVVRISFDFDVVYRPGVLNILPDRISRLYDIGVDNQPRVIYAIPAIESLEPDKEILDIRKRVAQVGSLWLRGTVQKSYVQRSLLAYNA